MGHFSLKICYLNEPSEATSYNNKGPFSILPSSSVPIIPSYHVIKMTLFKWQSHKKLISIIRFLNYAYM